MTDVERKAASVSYILNFYNEVTRLTTLFGQYHNYLLGLEQRYDGTSIENLQKLTEEDKTALITLCQMIRQDAMTAHIRATQLKTIRGYKGFDSKFETAYKGIKDQYFIRRDDMLVFLDELHAFLMVDVMQELLQSSQDFVQGVYGNEERTQ